MAERRPIMRLVFIAYLALGVLALLVVPASVFGLAGIEPDPLSGIFALILGLPWTLVLSLTGDIGTWGALAVCTLAIVFNAYLLWRLSRRNVEG